MADRSVTYTDTIEQFFQTYNLTAADVGDISTLYTTATDLSAALNELHGTTPGNDVQKDALTIDAIHARAGLLASMDGDLGGVSIVAGLNTFYTAYDTLLAPGTSYTTVAQTTSGAINELESQHNTLNTKVGTPTGLAADIQDAVLTIAVGKVDTKFENLIGNLASGLNAGLTNTDVIVAINSVDTKYSTFTGHGTALNTTATALAGAVNELHGEINTNTSGIATLNTLVGTLSLIHVDIRSGTSVAASLDTFYDAYLAKIAPGTALTTSATTHAAAINELESNHNALDTRVGPLATINDAIEGASIAVSLNNAYTIQQSDNTNRAASVTALTGTTPTNEATADVATVEALHYRVGLLSNLDAGISGANDNNLVAAINYVYGLQTGATVAFTNATLSGTLDVTGLATFSGGLTIDAGGFTSLGIDDNATSNKFQIENALISAKTNVAVTGTMTASGIATASDFVFGATTGSLHNGSGERVDFTSSTITLVASAASIAAFANAGITFYKDVTSAFDISLTGSGTLNIAGSEVFHPGNMGSGSGLDADLLDGVQLVNIARTDVAETFTSDVTITGNLVVNGTTTTVNTETVLISDNIITLNSDVTGTPSQNGGFEIERGTSLNVSILWNEASDYWQLTNDGSTYTRILTTADSGAGNAFDADKLDGQHGSYYLAWANLTGVPSTFTPSSHVHAAADVTSGTFSTARIPSLAASIITSGTFADARISDMAASKLTAGTISLTTSRADLSYLRLTSNATTALTANGDIIWNSTTGMYYRSGGVNYKIWSEQNDGPGTGLNADLLDGLEAAAFATASHTHVATDITSGTFLDARIPALAASKTTSGTFDVARIPSLPTSIITSGTFVDARIPSLAASKVTTGVFDVARIPEITVAMMAAGAVQLSTDAFADVDSILMTAAAVDDLINSKGYTTNTGDVTGVTAGSGLTGGGTSGALTINIGAGTGITVAADAISVDMTAFSTTNLGEGTNLYYTATRANAAIDARVTQAFVNGLSVSAGSLSGIGAGSFLRSDAADTATSKITFNAGIRLNDSDIIEFGSSADGEMFHNGSHQYLDINLGDFIIRDGTTTRYTFATSTGDFTATGNITAYSDLRLKTKDSDIIGALHKLKSIDTMYYYWNDKAAKIGIASTVRQVGVTAQSVEKVMPEVVHEDDGGNKTVSYEKLVPLLIEAIKELEAKVARLERK